MKIIMCLKRVKYIILQMRFGDANTLLHIYISCNYIFCNYMVLLVWRGEKRLLCLVAL